MHALLTLFLLLLVHNFDRSLLKDRFSTLVFQEKGCAYFKAIALPGPYFWLVFLLHESDLRREKMHTDHQLLFDEQVYSS